MIRDVTLIGGTITLGSFLISFTDFQIPVLTRRAEITAKEDLLSVLKRPDRERGKKKKHIHTHTHTATQARTVLAAW